MNVLTSILNPKGNEPIQCNSKREKKKKIIGGISFMKVSMSTVQGK